MRHAIVSGGSFLVAVGAGVLISPTVAVIFVAIGMGAILGGLEPVAARSPSLRWTSSPDGFSISYQRPRRATKNRLRSEALTLAADMHAYVEQQPVTYSTFESESHAPYEAMDAAPDAQEKERIWNAHTDKIATDLQREGQKLRQLFGGRILAVLTGFRQRGLLDESEATQIEWHCGSLHWFGDAAAQIEAPAPARLWTLDR